MNKEERNNGIIVNVLGEPYEIYAVKQEDAPHLFSNKTVGSCNRAVKEIVVENFPDETHSAVRSNKQALHDEVMFNEVLRHELVHAFFGECGLDSEVDSAFDEEMIADWLAIQAPKLMKLFCQVKAFTDAEMKSFNEAYEMPNKIIED